MMGVSVSGPSYIYGDNMSVIHNTQWPELTLKKKLNSICYHAVRESVAMGESLTGHISTHNNPADICTKLIPGGMKRDHLVGLVLYDICDHSWFVPPTLGTEGYKVSLSLSDRISGLRWYDNQSNGYGCDLATKW
jgi:hypothetical protein